MPLEISYIGETGKNLFATLQRKSDDYWWDVTNTAWATAPLLVDKKILLAEGAGELTGDYVASVSGLGDAEHVRVRIHDDADSNDKVIGSADVRVMGGEEVFGDDGRRVWSHATRTLTQSAASVVAAVAGTVITVIERTTWSISLTGLGSLQNRDKLWFTLKAKPNHDDAKALLQVEEGTGLLIANGSTNVTATDAAITVGDEINGDLTIRVEAAATGVTTGEAHVYDLKLKISGGDVQQIVPKTKFRVMESVTDKVT